MQRKAPFLKGSFYHVYNRGADRRIIFSEKNDHLRFMGLLYACNSTESLDVKRFFERGRPFTEVFKEQRGEQLTDIGAYCLMPNHYHLLLHELVPGGISQFMKKLGTAYAMYFNRKYKRTGTLFEGRFKAMLVAKESYFEYLFAYIHLNPLKLIDPEWKSGIRDVETARAFLERYTSSSYLDFVGTTRPEGAIVNRDPALWHNYFKNVNDFRDFIHLWLASLEREERGDLDSMDWEKQAPAKAAVVVQ